MPMIMVILDGLPDVMPTDSRPFYELPQCINLAKISMGGAYGCFETAPQGFAVDSLTCIATLLGVGAHSLPRGRAYLEALSGGIEVGVNDAVCRCNLVEVNKNDSLISSCAQGAAKVRASGYKLFHMGGYKNLLVCAGKAAQAAKTSTMPPHEHIGEPIKSLLPQNTPLAQALREIAVGSKVMKDGKTCMLFPWDVTARQVLPSFRALHGLSAAAVCTAEIVRGIALAMGMAVVTPAGTTGEDDTDLAAKAQAAAELAKRYDLVLVHVNGADELAHRHDAAGKAAFLARIDKELIGALLADAGSGTALLVTSDHATLSATGKHMGGPQPFVLHGGTVRGGLGTLSGEKAVTFFKSAAR